MLNHLKISNFQKGNWAIPKKSKGGLRTYLFNKKPGSFRFVTLAPENLHKTNLSLSLEIL